MKSFVYLHSLMKSPWKYYLLSIAVILIDQALKLWVHFNLDMGAPGQIKVIGNYFRIYYTLNPGMAFGIRLSFKYGKILLTWGRIVASFMIGRYVWQWSQRKERTPLTLWGWASVLGGALGNVIDSTFYGVWLKNAIQNAPTPWFHGQVIDMLYIDIWEVKLPTWVPFMGGDYLSFSPIFNLADVAILLGVITILWARRIHRRKEAEALTMAH